MGDQPARDMPIPDPAALGANLVKIAARSRKLVSEFLSRQMEPGAKPPSADPFNIGSAFLEMTQRMMANPARLAEANLALWQDYLTLWQTTTLRLMGQEPKPVIKPAKGDKRFNHADWDENGVFDFIKQSYLLTARWLQHTVHNVEGLDPKTAKKVDFYTKQFVDAMAPSNFVLTNPQVLRTTLESNGENLVRGLETMLKDLDDGKGQLAIKMTDMNAFEVGRNIAITPGKVVFQNDIIQLIQYIPKTAETYRRPLLIVPPWINKFYILDLRQDNSFIKWMLEKGYTVFVVSWVNPDEKLAERTFEDYMDEGILAALGAIEQATGETHVNAIGYCIGGTLMGATLAYMAATGDDRIQSCTFFAAQVDFSEAGELSIFIDEEQLENIESMMQRKGFLDGQQMSTTFNMLRANDLIWSFVVNNYLLGKDPFPFDLLFWNADATRMPTKLHSFYLRECYQANNLAKPGGVTLRGVPIDLRQVKIPIYLQASRDDHIAPYRSVFKATKLYSGPIRFMVAGSGHIAGVINPPAAKKYQHWLNDKSCATVEEWFAGAVEHPGSWWEDWDAWLAPKSGDKVPARVPGDAKLKVLEDAPGSYVKVRS
ncbi:PHA/PHB synthase family protein [Zavarzinia sp. CC-PAN008]|uniref:PHA/PHB synthase family protein n=1 Tax=Zavarzinia sp. CC-PAN008 TaxID=3243332 RepID=UPI003F7424D8